MNKHKPQINCNDDLFYAVERLAELRGYLLDRSALEEVVWATRGDCNAVRRLALVARHLKVKVPRWSDRPDVVDLPALVETDIGRWGLLRALGADGRWVGERFDDASKKWEEHVYSNLELHRFASMRLVPPFKLIGRSFFSFFFKGIKLKKAKFFDRFAPHAEGVHHPIDTESVRGDYRFEQVVIRHEVKPVVQLPDLTIQAGEKIAILGPIGAGKTTLLRLLSGMCTPSEGRIYLDGVDLEEISKPLLHKHIGYLPQVGGLADGTLRENLALGQVESDDEVLLAAARVTGFYDAVIVNHPKGLQFEIKADGTGLSHGQSQLLKLTRVFLRKPRIWLLDDPTALLDRTTERHVVQALGSAVQQQDTLVLVTHKPELLQLVDRVIVLDKHRVIMDASRDEVIAMLNGAKNIPPKTRLRLVKVV